MSKRLWHHFAGLTRTTFERYGFAYAEILSQWPAIVGQELAAISRPERLRWPRRPPEEEATPPATRRHTRKLGGVLVVRVSDGRALEVQHDTPRIIERINSYYGYAAIAELKVIQGPLPNRAEDPPREPPRLDAPAERVLDRTVAVVEHDRLREALHRLGRGVKSPGRKPRR